MTVGWLLYFGWLIGMFEVQRAAPSPHLNFAASAAPTGLPSLTNPNPQNPKPHAPLRLSTSALITLPSADSERLILVASLSRSPVVL